MDRGFPQYQYAGAQVQERLTEPVRCHSCQTSNLSTCLVPP
jgi:hypothetical protein